MTAEPIPFDFDLAKRFTDCRSFRFAPGVLLYGGDRITERTAAIDVGVVPDYRDGATRGVMLDQIRATFGDPRAHIAYRTTYQYWQMHIKTNPYRALDMGPDHEFVGKTEAAVLLAAFVAADTRNPDGTIPLG